jgi:methyl-accepting chemotaxis protein
MEAADQSVEKTRAVGREIGEEVKALSNLTGEVTEALKGSLDALDQSKDTLKTATSSANMNLEQAAETIRDHAQTIDKAADHAGERMDVIGDGIRQRSEDLTTVADDAQSRLSGFREGLQKLMLDFEESTNRGAAQVAIASEQMRTSLDEFGKTSERIVGGVRQTDSGFRNELENLGTSADKAVARVEVVLKTLRKHAGIMVDASNEITDQTAKASSTFQRQVEELLYSSNKASTSAKKLDDTNDKAKTAKFMEETAYVFEQLHSLSVDIARIFEPSVEEELWKLYHKGDQSVFLRHVNKSLGRQKLSAIQTKYETDEKFRTLVIRYLKEYSSLVKHARATDRAEFLTTTFSTSDLGKLNMLLSKAMESASATEES